MVPHRPARTKGVPLHHAITSTEWRLCYGECQCSASHDQDMQRYHSNPRDDSPSSQHLHTHWYHPLHRRAATGLTIHETRHHIVMKSCSHGHFNPAVLTIAAAVACTCLVQYLSARDTESELVSETLCWIILPFISRTQTKHSTNVLPPTPTKKRTGSLQPWGPAVFVAALSFCKAELGAVVSLFVSHPCPWLQWRPLYGYKSNSQ